MELKFRNLKASEVEARVGNINKGGVTVLLYQDARVAMSLLDEVVGPTNWQKSYSRDNANCTISIWDKEKGQWVSKEDTGKESNMEAEKGLASDSFKRASVCWGIGRALYDSPHIFFFKNELKGYSEAGNPKEKPKCSDTFRVVEMEYCDDDSAVSSVTVEVLQYGTPYLTKTFVNERMSVIVKDEKASVKKSTLAKNAEPAKAEAKKSEKTKPTQKEVKGELTGNGRIFPDSEIICVGKDFVGANLTYGAIKNTAHWKAFVCEVHENPHSFTMSLTEAQKAQLRTIYNFKGKAVY